MVLALDPDNALDRVRAAAQALPETGETDAEGQPAFHVAGRVFARYRADPPTLQLRTDPKAGDTAVDGFDTVVLNGGDPDWQRIEDRMAQAWEITAPRHLLEAGGR